MTSFKDKIKEKESSHAYCNGAAFYNSKNLPKLAKSPYKEDSKEDLEWLDGFYDAWYMDMTTR